MIVNVQIRRISTIISLGANAIRFDELDTCTTSICQEHYNEVMKQVFIYMVNNSIKVIGNNNSNHFPGLPSIAKIMVESNLQIVGWIVESGQTITDLYILQETIGNRVPIYAICSRDDCNTDDGHSYDTIPIFKSISYYNY